MGSVPWSEKAPGNAFLLFLGPNGADGPNKPNEPNGTNEPNGLNKPHRPDGPNKQNEVDKPIMLANLLMSDVYIII